MSEVRIVVVADDKSKAELDRVVQNIERVGDSGQRAAGGFQVMSRAAVGLTQAAERGYGILTRLDLVQITLEQSTTRVRASQEAYNQAVQNFGVGSRQAIDASRQLEAAQNNLEKAQVRARLSTVLIVGDVVGMAARIPDAVRALSALRASMVATTGAAAGMSVALTGGLAAVGIVAGIVAVNQAIQGTGSAAEFGTRNLDELRERLRAVEHDIPILEQLQHAPSLSRVFEFVPGKHSPGETLRIARREAEGLREEIAALEEQQAAYAEAESRRALILAGDEATIRAAIDESTAALAAYDEQLRQPLALDEREQISFQYDREREQLAALQGALQEVENVGLRAAQSLNQGLSQVGANLSNLTAQAAEAVRLQVGIDPDIAAGLRATTEAEQRLATEALRSSKALRDQTTITAKKDETTEDFTQRLRTMGFTEQEIRERIDETGRALRSQAEAAQETAEATDFLTASLAAGAGGGRFANLGGPNAAQGLDVPARASGIQSATRSVVRPPRAERSGRQAIISLDEELQNAINQNPDLLKIPSVKSYFEDLQILRERRYSDISASQRGRVRRVAGKAQELAPFLTAANGFHGDVNRPTVMLVGEAGQERVDVTPRGQAGPERGNLTVVNHLAPGTDPREVTRAVARGYEVGKRRIAARRSH